MAFSAVAFLALPALAAGPELHVIDGDTLERARDDGSIERIRIENIDAPEVYHPRCPAERDRGLVASGRMVALLAAGPVVIERHGSDRFGRTLAIVTAGGRDVGAAMIAEGLARPWRGHTSGWCGGS